MIILARVNECEHKVFENELRMLEINQSSIQRKFDFSTTASYYISVQLTNNVDVIISKAYDTKQEAEVATIDCSNIRRSLTKMIRYTRIYLNPTAGLI